jgi:N6-adenosine-specific RNA methylase IME4
MDTPGKTRLKQARRAANEAALASRILALPEKRYGAIVADPGWSFETYSDKGKDRSAENHYACQSLQDICALPVRDIAARDCVLFLWTTAPFLEHAFTVIRAWGFSYKSNFVWVKQGNAATGYWSRGRHEHLLVATRGNIPAPAPGTQSGSVIEAPKGAHSVKPVEALIMIESYFPSLPKIELHCRGAARPGWDAWGAEVVRC